MANLPADFDLQSYIVSLFKDKLGRQPDNSGLGYWDNNSQQWLDQGGTPKLDAAFVSGIRGPEDTRFNAIKSNMAPQANQLTQPNAFAWDDYMRNAAAQQQGMNNMPGVFSNYAGLAGATPEQAQAMMYRTPEEQATAIGGVNDYWTTAGGLGGLGGTAKDKTKTTDAATDTTVKTPNEKNPKARYSGEGMR